MMLRIKKGISLISANFTEVQKNIYLFFLLLQLLNTERIPMQIFTATLQVSFLLFESMRIHLKFQLENFLNRLQEIIVSENPKISYDKKELALGKDFYTRFGVIIICFFFLIKLYFLRNPRSVVENTRIHFRSILKF